MARRRSTPVANRKSSGSGCVFRHHLPLGAYAQGVESRRLIIDPSAVARMRHRHPGVVLATARCAMRVQAVHLQRLRHTESVKHAADTVDAQAPEGALAVVVHQFEQPLELVPSSWVEL